MLTWNGAKSLRGRPRGGALFRRGHLFAPPMGGGGVGEADGGQRTFTLASPHVYLEARLDVPGRKGAAVDAAVFEGVVGEALRQLYGYVGGGIPFEIIAFDPAESTGVVRVEKGDSEKMLAALAMMSHFDGREARLHLLAASPALLSLGNRSRAVFAQYVGEP